MIDRTYKKLLVANIFTLTNSISLTPESNILLYCSSISTYSQLAMCGDSLKYNS